MSVDRLREQASSADSYYSTLLHYISLHALVTIDTDARQQIGAKGLARLCLRRSGNITSSA